MSTPTKPDKPTEIVDADLDDVTGAGDGTSGSIWMDLGYPMQTQPQTATVRTGKIAQVDYDFSTPRGD